MSPCSVTAFQTPEPPGSLKPPNRCRTRKMRNNHSEQAHSRSIRSIRVFRRVALGAKKRRSSSFRVGNNTMNEHDAEAMFGGDFPFLPVAEPRATARMSQNLCPAAVASQRLARKEVKATLVHRRKSLKFRIRSQRGEKHWLWKRTIGSRVKNLKMAIEWIAGIPTCTCNL